MFRSKKATVINTQVLRVRSDKIAKRVRRDAKKRLKRGELTSAHGLVLYLNHIDDAYSHLKADVKNARLLADYESVRADKVAEAGSLIQTHDAMLEDLDRIKSNLLEKAREAGREGTIKVESRSSIDITPLRTALAKLTQPAELRVPVTRQKTHPQQPQRSLHGRI